MQKSSHREWRPTYSARPWVTTYNIVVVTVLLGVVLLIAELVLLGRQLDDGHEYVEREFDEHSDFYPETVMHSLFAQPVANKDLLHLALLHEACVSHKDSVIPWTYGLEGIVAEPSTVINREDPDLLEKMRVCPDVDIFLPGGIRGHGYCEDSIAYTKYLQSRMLPMWALEMTYKDEATGESFSYHDLCPQTPMIFLNHYWDGLTDKPEWPVDKPKYLMPNIEMYELNEKHYWDVDVVLCKTAICARRVRLWYEQEGNPKNTKVVYTRHTSSDIAALARSRLEDGAIQEKDFTQVNFVHAVGTSVQKGTKQVLECWLQRPDYPHLDMFVNEDIYDGQFKAPFGEAIAQASDRITLHLGRVDATEFGKMVAEKSFFLCPSLQEGYGHYINQARATGAVIVTTDLPPMNELLSPTSAVLVPVTRWGMPEQMLAGQFKGDHGLRDVEGYTAKFRQQDVCTAVDQVLAMTPAQREAMAQQARRQYDIDTNFFATKMMELRFHARAQQRLRSP